jgi:hypothetical protein
MNRKQPRSAALFAALFTILAASATLFFTARAGFVLAHAAPLLLIAVIAAVFTPLVALFAPLILFVHGRLLGFLGRNWPLRLDEQVEGQRRAGHEAPAERIRKESAAWLRKASRIAREQSSP